METVLVSQQVPRQGHLRNEVASSALDHCQELYRVAKALLRSDPAAERVVLATYALARRSPDFLASQDLRLLLHRTLLGQIDIESRKRISPAGVGTHSEPLLGALQTLPLRVSRLLVLADAIELTLRELSFVLREPEPEIARQLAHARASLRTQLQQSRSARTLTPPRH